MINPFSSIINYNEGDDFFDEYLEKIHVFNIFKELLDEFPEKKIFKGIVKYILWAYSLESDELLLNGETFEKTSHRIYKKAELPSSLYEDVALVKNEVVHRVIGKWIRHQDEEEFTNYLHFRDLRREMLSSSTGSILKSTGEQDFEQKMKNAHHAKELLEMMKEALAKYIQNSPKMKNSMKHYESVIVTKNTATVEDFLNHKQSNVS